ncbi:MAG: hypothetical protein FJY65_12095 [Calditrichaeota bacterium]|nr:hypothetical protein [Calditrichota bacterium]
MRCIIALLILFIFFSTIPAFADLQPGEKLPNPTLKNQSGAEVGLHSLLKTVNVVHLWKGD